MSPERYEGSLTRQATASERTVNGPGTFRSAEGERRLAVEPVADAADGHDQLRVVAVLLDPGTPTLDVGVQGLGVAHVVVAPDPVDQGLAGQHPVAVLHQDLEQLELLEGEVDRLAADGDLVPLLVKTDAAGLDDGRLVARLDVAGGGPRRQGARPCDQLTQGER